MRKKIKAWGHFSETIKGKLIEVILSEEKPSCPTNSGLGNCIRPINIRKVPKKKSK